MLTVLVRPAPDTTIPTPDGGTIVNGIAVTQGFEGTGLESGVTYRALEAEFTFGKLLPPPGTGPFRAVQALLLLPQGDAPAMLLVTVLKGTVAADGTLDITLERSYLLCQPRGRSTPR